ncbi:ABC-2 family transporter protein [Aerococcaceae bacterium NML210727]|nr:ABC-2 family transporter protein [Aerococcaceae bacterium NML210727]MCW6655183.1 ABC-2 family transporter protein [Aerococcaceae bacterium NML201296]MCW6661358.1 ABC-2 family transporter protein [Aerococcaceae bacterium NML201209]MCW6665651.1 ABC-2 family transporter protein [Aerococcaceae bacterium NML191219]
MKVYFPYIHSAWKTRMAYGANVIVWIFADIFQVISMLFIWYIIYTQGSQESINGFNFNSVLLYTIMANLTVNLYQLDVDFIIAEEISSGEIVNNFIRPISYVKRLIAESMGTLFFDVLFLLVPIVSGLILYTHFTKIDFGVTIESVALYTVALSLSIVINFILSFMIGMAAFYVNYIWGFITLKGAFMMLVTGQLFPLTFLPEWIVGILKLTPFYYMNFGPVSILLNRFSRQAAWHLIGIQGLWCVILAGIAHVVWQSAQKRLSVNGG